MQEWDRLIASRSGELGKATTRAEVTFRAIAATVPSHQQTCGTWVCVIKDKVGFLGSLPEYPISSYDAFLPARSFASKMTTKVYMKTEAIMTKTSQGSLTHE